MKYGLLALALIAALPGCSCMRKDKKPKEEKKTEKKMKDGGKEMKSAADKGTSKAKSGKEHMSSY